MVLCGFMTVTAQQFQGVWDEEVEPMVTLVGEVDYERTVNDIYDAWQSDYDFTPESIIMVDKTDRGILGTDYMIFGSPSERPQTIFVQPIDVVQPNPYTTINLPKPPPGYTMRIEYIPEN